MKLTDIDTNILLRNNTPLDDFLGMTPADIHDLLYDTFGERSPVQIYNIIDNTTLDKISFFRIAEELLKILQRDGFIKLTPLGALPKKVMVELYTYKFIPDELLESGITKLWKQQDCISIQTARFVTETAGLVKKVNNKLSLRKNGSTLLKSESRAQLFKRIFSAFAQQFSWSFNDGYPDHPIGQLGWALSVFLLNKFGDKPRTSEFYAEKYLAAFPNFISFFHSDYATPKEQFMRCYGVRTFDRFLLWFGFVTVEKGKDFFDLDKFTATDLVRKVFWFEEL